VTYLEETGWDLDWIDLAQDRDTWRAVVNTVMDSGLHKMQGISRRSEELFIIFSDGLSSCSLLGNEQATLHNGTQLQQYSHQFIFTVTYIGHCFISTS